MCRNVEAQSPVTNLTLGPNQIGLARVAVGITTRLSFQQPVKEIICGDLYDPGSGTGTFVIQRSDRDVYIKPIAAKGSSNMFVKTGTNGENVFNFDINVVPLQQAHRVVNVALPEVPAVSTREKEPVPAQPQVDVEGILRNAREQASKIIGEAEQKARETQQEAEANAEQQAEERFLQGLLNGIQETRLNNPKVTNKRYTIILDPRVLVFDERAYLRFTLQNTGSSDLAYSSITLEALSNNINKSIPVELFQSKTETTITPGETVTCILTFDPAAFGPRDSLTLNVRGEGNSEIARVRITP